MGSTKVHLEKMEARKNYSNLWHADLIRSPQSDPLFCCFALLCGPCASYMLRKRALYNDMSRYTCCGGYMPCSGRCGESNCPEFCLCTEVFLCFANSVASTRFMLQDEFNIQTTKCDNCIIGFMFCLQQLACIFSIIALLVGSEDIEEASQLLNCLSDMVYCTVCPCMQTQHKTEMDKRDGKFGAPSVMAVPPVQQMSRIDQPVPPQVGYPPPPPYGQPPNYLPPVYGMPPGYPPPPPVYGPPTGYPPPPPGYGHPPGYPSLPQPQAEGYTSPPPQPQPQGFPPATYPPQGYGYPPANYPAHPPPDNNR